MAEEQHSCHNGKKGHNNWHHNGHNHHKHHDGDRGNEHFFKHNANNKPMQNAENEKLDNNNINIDPQNIETNAQDFNTNTSNETINNANNDTVNNAGNDELIAKLTSEKEEAEDRYKRLLAEFDNFRKRTEKEKEQSIDYGISKALTKILPVVDNLERALATVSEEQKQDPFVDGIDKTYKMVMKTFEEMEVTPIEALGQQFDANLHNAVMTDEESDAEPETITAELQKGYKYKDQVLRYAMVKVKK